MRVAFRHLRRLRNRRPGQSSRRGAIYLEFLLVFPILFIATLALFEFLFFTGLRISEALALQWQDVGTVHIRRTVALGELEERTKTGSDRFVLLNQRALRALWFAKVYADRRLLGVGRVTSTPHVLPPSKGQVHVKQTSNVHHQWRPTLQVLGIRYRPPYNCRHTYATMCLTVRPQPRLYRSAARPLRANADLNIRALDQLNL